MKRNLRPRIMLLADLSVGWPKLSAAMGQVMAECASVCLNNQGHGDEVSLFVNGAYKVTYSVQRLAVTGQLQSTHGDLQDATEWGACGFAILMMRDLTPYTVVERAWKGGGFDYWLGDKDDPLFQKRARLEVSGILTGDASAIRTRIKQKLSQSDASDNTNTPAYAVVVEFSQPTARIEIK